MVQRTLWVGCVQRNNSPDRLRDRGRQEVGPDDSGLMMAGSPRDRNVRTQDRFEPEVCVHAHVDQRSNRAWFEPAVYVGAHVIETFELRQSGLVGRELPRPRSATHQQSRD